MAMSAGDADEKPKQCSFDDLRVDSGIDSLRWENRAVRCASGSGTEPVSESEDDQGGETGRGEQDKVVPDERLDSAYGSASLSTDSLSLSEIVERCDLSATPTGPGEKTESSEDEGNVFTTLTDEGDTVVHLMIIVDSFSIALQLIYLFPKEILDIQNNLYQAPLHLAVYLNQVGVVKALVEKGVSLTLQDQEGNTPLHMACEHGRLDCANEMIGHASATELAPLFETQNWRGLTCLHIATLHKHHRMMRLLMKKGVDLNIQEGTSGKTALHMAVEQHDMDAVDMLLKRGANVDAAMLNGCTALHLAVGRQDATITSHLCQAGADQMIRNIEDDTALDLADGNDDILALLPFDDIQIMGRTVGLNF